MNMSTNSLKRDIVTEHQSSTIDETPTRMIKSNERASWSNRIVYLLSIIGFVVDLGKLFFSGRYFFIKDRTFIP